MSKFALIIPTFNSAHTVEKTIESVLALGDELSLLTRVIITDDGSKDDTLAIVRRIWNSKVPLDILETPANRGEYLNVNSAVMSLKPEEDWYLLIHSDNWAKKGWVSSLISEANKADASVGSVCTSYDLFYLNGTLVPGDDTGRVTTFPGCFGAVYDTLRSGCWWHNSTAAVRVKAFKDVGGMPARQNLSQMGDWDFSIRLSANGWGITYIERPLITYVENEASVSSKNFRLNKDIRDRLEVTGRYLAGCPQGQANAIFWRIAKILMRRIGSSAFKGHWRRLAAALALVPKFIATWFKSVGASKREPVPVRCKLVYE